MTLLDPAAKKRAAIEAAKALSQSAKPDALATKPPEVKRVLIDPEKAESRIRIVADNSVSMSDSLSGVWSIDPKDSKMEAAKKGIVEFLRNCTLNKDAVAIHFLNKYNSFESEDTDGSILIPSLINNSTLSTDLILIASSIDNKSIVPIDGTPLYPTLINAMNTTPLCTRIVAFSDGQPDNQTNEEDAIKKAIECKIPIDTVFFGDARSKGASLMQTLAERTGGIYIVFDPAKGVNFASAFKYLAPVNRLRLMNAEFKAKLERGEIK